MKTALILLLGNRDVQIPLAKEDDLKNKIAKHLVVNNEGAKEYLVINKSKKAELTFLETAKLCLDELDYLYPFLEYPMLNATLKILEDRQIIVDTVYLTTSQQSPPHFQDSFYFAEIIAQHLKNIKLPYDLKLCAHNPNDFPKMVTFYSNLFEEVATDFEHIIISNSGGTPTMRSASHFAGIFRGFDYITINSSDEANLETFKKQEDLVLKKIITSMLEVYDYEGILKLPNVSNDTRLVCQYALARIALNFQKAKTVIKPIRENSPLHQQLYQDLDKDFETADLEREMYFSAKIKFHQGSYSDYLWRLFTIYENMFLPYAEKVLGGKIEFDKENNHQSWKILLEHYEQLNPGFKAQLQQVKINRTNLEIDFPSKYAYRPIVAFAKDKVVGIPIEIFTIADCLEALSALRNAAAHKYKGFGLTDINMKMPKKKLGLSKSAAKNGGAVQRFNDVLSQYFNTKWDNFGVYEKINRLLLSKL